MQAACHAPGTCRETRGCVPLCRSYRQPKRSRRRDWIVHEDTDGRRFGRLRQELAAWPAAARARSDRQFALVRAQGPDYPRSTALAQLLL
jgi:hypothetical protein